MEITRANVLMLKNRVKTGNEKLYNAWKLMVEADWPEDQISAFNIAWGEKYKELEKLCDLLIATGFDKCLYIVEGRKTRQCLSNEHDPHLWCIVCPCKELPPENQPFYVEVEEMFRKDKPRKCYACKSTAFYLNQGKAWTCAGCHPAGKLL